MVEQGYNYLDGPLHVMAKFFGTRIENLKKSIPPNVPSRNRKKSKKGFKKRKTVTFDDSEDEDSEEEHNSKSLPVPWHVRTYYG